MSDDNDGVSVLIEQGMAIQQGEHIKLHNLIDCRSFAKTVWVDKILLKLDLAFSADRLHDILHANSELYYDTCPGSSVIDKWFREFAKEVC